MAKEECWVHFRITKQSTKGEILSWKALNRSMAQERREWGNTETPRVLKCPPSLSFKTKHHILTNFYIRLAMDNFQPLSTEWVQSPMTLGHLWGYQEITVAFFPHLENLFCHGAWDVLIKTHCIEMGMCWEVSYCKPFLDKTLLGINGRQEQKLRKGDPEQGPVRGQDHKHRLNLFVVFHLDGSYFVWAEKVKSGSRRLFSLFPVYR